MEISTEINKEKNIRYHIVSGAIDVNELIKYLKGIYDASDFNSEMSVFWNLQKADSSAVSSKDVDILSEYVGRQWGKGGKSKAALVVSNDLDYGMSRMYQIMMEGPTHSKIQVFRDINEAEEWLKEE